ncbi:Ca2+:H+ antiporter [Fistulifera solaris]|uniref:Ca2+:H+ antiporter n=1 Tax=Fistulifera solaris TaxID=1519565 RepID=A0A1Z5JCG9_FISSO|nr:Ca2+:H+ antiporter [Fistulifera solaris]|eukprot:GAX11700.1 Ca2+:H+ antiporter [Fistulifera solaris]
MTKHPDEEETLPLTRKNSPRRASSSLLDELRSSTDIVFQSRYNWLLVLGPMAVLGEASGTLNEAACFAFSGLALIPLAERLSFITEQVAEHTNGTIGALLNATFGNAPELLISVAALNSGYYRVVQLAMLGSMFTNMILVFGVACLIGGFRWQVQELRLTSGNVNVLMLMLSTSGLLFPAALVLTGQLDLDVHNRDDRIPSKQEVKFSRVNAAVMLILYLCFLLFQLGTHKDEFDEKPRPKTKFNAFCRRFLRRTNQDVISSNHDSFSQTELRLLRRKSHQSESKLLNGNDLMNIEEDDTSADGDSSVHHRRRQRKMSLGRSIPTADAMLHSSVSSDKMKHALDLDFSSTHHDDEDGNASDDSHAHHSGPLISLRVGIGWLFIITLCVSAITDVLVETIDGFAARMGVSQVFTSMVIVPFFSNVAEQVSAFLFAYRNEMDLCVGVTVGSAIQIATFVLPGSVLIGMMMDRSMTLFFHGYETVSLFFGVMVVGVILQSGTTNWLVGAILVGIYVIFASGIWFHEVEELTVDAETFRVSGG